MSLGEQGAFVGVHYNASRDAAEKVASTIEHAGGNAFLVAGDMARHDSVSTAVEETGRHFGRIDGLINNAGALLDRLPIE